MKMPVRLAAFVACAFVIHAAHTAWLLHTPTKLAAAPSSEAAIHPAESRASVATASSALVGSWLALFWKPTTRLWNLGVLTRRLRAPVGARRWSKAQLAV